MQSHKSLKQTALLTVADLLNVACESAHLHNKRFPVQLIDDFCDAKDSGLLDEFLNILSQELQSSTSSTSDKLITMMAIGSLGIEEILPVLLPHIEGNAQGDDTAERAAAILALKRVIYINPERVSWNNNYGRYEVFVMLVIFSTTVVHSLVYIFLISQSILTYRSIHC